MKEENLKFNIENEHGIQKEAELITVLEDNGNEYAVYSTKVDEENEDVYVSKIIHNADGTETIIDIENEEERNKMFGIVREMFNNI